VKGGSAIESVLVELVLVDLRSTELQKGTIESPVEKLFAFSIGVEVVSEVAQVGRAIPSVAYAGRCSYRKYERENDACEEYNEKETKVFLEIDLKPGDHVSSALKERLR